MLADRLPRWRSYAACRGRGELFYDTDRFAEQLACAICSTCGVRDLCLAAALEEEHGPSDTYGVRGGLTAEQRRTRKRRDPFVTHRVTDDGST